MARTVKDKNLQTSEARRRLPVRGKPHWRTLEEGLHIGFRRLASGAGKWVVRFYDGDGAYVTETIALADDLSDANDATVLSFDQAQRKARELRDTRDRSAAGKTGPITVADAMRRYLERLEHDGKATRDAELRIDAHILPALGAVRVDALTADRITKWRSDLAKTPARVRSKAGSQRYKALADGDDEAQRRRRSTVNRTLTVLKAALTAAFTAGHVTGDSAWRTVKPFRAVDVSRVRYLTVDEAKRLINACSPDFRRLVEAALLTGMRYSELGRLQVRDFNPDAGTVTVRKSKSAKVRHVPLSDEGADFFAALCAGRAGDEVMLMKADGGIWKKSHQLWPMRDALARARITPAVSFHELRHTYCSLAAMRGVPLMAIAAAVGHTSTRMTEKHYAHLSASFVADEIRKGAPVYGIEAGNVKAIR